MYLPAGRMHAAYTGTCSRSLTLHRGVGIHWWGVGMCVILLPILRVYGDVRIIAGFLVAVLCHGGGLCSHNSGVATLRVVRTLANGTLVPPTLSALRCPLG